MGKCGYFIIIFFIYLLICLFVYKAVYTVVSKCCTLQIIQMKTVLDWEQNNKINNKKSKTPVKVWLKMQERTSETFDKTATYK